MQNYYADLHIHLGASSVGTPVKITASKKLTFDAVIQECSRRKGIHIAGIVDCAAPKVIKDMERPRGRRNNIRAPRRRLHAQGQASYNSGKRN